jgi:hypothetical protein
VPKGKKIVMAAVMCGGLAASPVAYADTPGSPASAVKATATASSGSVDVTIDGTKVFAGAVGPCSADGPVMGSTRGGLAGTIAEFGNGEALCGRGTDGTAVGQAKGARFKTTVLKAYGGPEIDVRTFTAQCSTTAVGAGGYVEVGTVTGITVPANIPANYTITVPAPDPGAPPLADVVLNESVSPTPPDGSLTTNTLHIKLFPQGGPASGDIYVGTAACDPYGSSRKTAKPVPQP